MTARQKIELRRSQIRSRLGEIAALEGDALTDEVTAERDRLMGELQASEPQLRAAIEAEGTEARQRTDDDGEGAELRALTARASAGRIFAAVLEHRQTAGAEGELQEHLGLKPNQIPLAMLQQRQARRALETRAVTPAPGNVGTMQDPIIPAIFPLSAAAFCGVDMPTVAVGEKTYPVIGTNATVSAPAKGAAVAETTGSFTAEVLSPSRLQASFFYSREDAAKFDGMDMALRMNLTDALASALDKQILTLTDEGLLDFGVDPAASAGAETFATYRTALFGNVDGTYAGTAMDVRLVVGADTYAHMAGQYRANTADDSALDSVNRVSGGVRVSAHVPAQAADAQQAVFCRGLGARHAVAPIWEGVTLIPDEITKASTGEIVLTAIMLFAFRVLRSDGFKRHAFKLA